MFITDLKNNQSVKLSNGDMYVVSWTYISEEHSPENGGVCFKQKELNPIEVY